MGHRLLRLRLAGARARALGASAAVAVALALAGTAALASAGAATAARAVAAAPVAAAVPVVAAAGPAARPPAPKVAAGGLAGAPGSLFLSAADLTRIRRDIATTQWAGQAWQRFLADATAQLRWTPSPPDPNLDFTTDGRGAGGQCGGSGWWCALYSPGLVDGFAAYKLALVYRISGKREYAASAKRILFAWAGRYRRPAERVGHMVAEPVGPMIKLFITADLLQPAMSRREKAYISRWAGQWIEQGMRLSDSAMDSPWTDPVEVGGEKVVPAPFGNSAFGQRAMAVWAAAVAGPAQLAKALDWNWKHDTKGGRDYGWTAAVDGMLVPGGGGETIEGRTRGSVGYGLFGWAELVLIADLARHAGWPTDLLTAETRDGGSLLSVAPFYAPIAAGDKPDPYSAAETFGTHDPAAVAGELRAWFETAYAGCPDRSAADCKLLAHAIASGGDGTRATNTDGHFLAWRALLGVPLAG